MTDKLEFSSYSYKGRDELCLKAGKEHAKCVLLIPPLFDELNRMRRMLVDVMRYLDQIQISSVMPDLPGSNESLFLQADASLNTWRQALAKCTEQHSCGSFVASFRGSALFDDFNADARIWRLAPVKGSTLLRTMMRAQIASDKESGRAATMTDLSQEAQTSAVNLAGNNVGPQLFRDLQQAKPSDVKNCRTVRLESDSQPADGKIPGSTLWLRAEPDSDPVLSTAIANDISDWIDR